MPKPVVPLREKLAKLEQRTKELLEQRQNEIMDIFNACSAITIDDALLAGFLLYASDENNKDSPIFKEFITLAKANKIPSKPKQTSKTGTKKVS